MDALEFGRWISDRRRSHGWSSQQAFVEAVHREPHLKTTGISESFLARLEAGLLVHPFRKSTRKRVLAMAELLCKTPHDLRTYLRAAELTRLSIDEAAYVNHLSERLAAQDPHPVWLLPPRPAQLLGRTFLVSELVKILSSGETAVCTLTGMAGVGKSVIAFEAVHQIAINEAMRRHVFPDGIATFTCTGRRGNAGLIALLNEITELFSISTKPTSRTAHSARSHVHNSKVEGTGNPTVPDPIASEPADAINQARIALAGKHSLLVLDDLDAQFPLRQALESLLAQNPNSIGEYNGAGEAGTIGSASRAILITSRYIPTPGRVPHHFHVDPLEPDAALELFTTLVGRPLYDEEQSSAEQVCTALGNLPLAIEAAASAVTTQAIPLWLLAAHVAENPLHIVEGEHEISSRLRQALEALHPDMQHRFALLATLGTPSFGLDCAAAIHTRYPQIKEVETDDASLHGLQESSGLHISKQTPGNRGISALMGLPLSQLAWTAADLGQFVRHSLVESLPGSSLTAASSSELCISCPAPRYRLHPLLLAHAMERLDQLEPHIVHAARRNVETYALAYLEHYRGEVAALEREREFLLATLTHLWQQKQYPLVIRFVTGLLPLVGRLGNYQTSKHIILRGIQASKYVQDQYHLAFFLYYLGKLLSFHGQLRAAQEILEESQAIAQSLGGPADLWHSLIILTYLAYHEGEYDAVKRLTKTYLQRSLDTEDSGSIASALFTCGFYARLSGQMDKAYDDFRSCLQLTNMHGPDAPPDKNNRFEMTVRAELARVQGDYIGSQAYTEEYISLAQPNTWLYATPDMLSDQMDFAHQQGMLDDAQRLARSIVELSKPIEAYHFQARAMKLLQQYADGQASYTHGMDNEAVEHQ